MLAIAGTLPRASSPLPRARARACTPYLTELRAGSHCTALVMVSRRTPSVATATRSRLGLPAPVRAEAVDVDDLLVDPVFGAVVDDGLAGLGLVRTEVVDDAVAAGAELGVERLDG